ncbi:MAG: D-alanine--D-alanine ligase family protein [Ilumatobacteraceae bacterium]
MNADGESRTHVIVLFGGESAEHDVSCVTAAHVLRALDSDRYRITTVGISRAGKWVLAPEPTKSLTAGTLSLPERLVAEGEPTSITPIIEQVRSDENTVVFPLLHGPMGEDGTVQGVLELANVAYVGAGVLGSAVAMDKGVARQLLAANNIAQPKFVSLRDGFVSDAVIDSAIEKLGLPVFVKPANMGSSIGVSKAHTMDEVRRAIAHALTFDEWLLIEEAIVGREIEVAILGNLEPRASVPGEIIPSHEFYDYEDKYVVDGAALIVPARLSAELVSEVQHKAIEIFKVLRADGMARVDFLYEENGRGFLCNEVNTIPGFTPISMYPKLWQASGLTYGQLLDELISLAIERHARQRRNTQR